MFNPLLFQGLYYLAKSRCESEKEHIPDCCEDCKHFRGMKRKCRKGWYPDEKDYFCCDQEDDFNYDEDFDYDDEDLDWDNEYDDEY